MRRWRRKQEDDDDILTFDGLEEDDDDEEEEEEKPKRRYAPPRPIKTRFHSEDDEYDDEPEGPTFEELEPKIRAGKYKPKSSDPWTAHVLYQTLRDLGEI